MYLLLTISPCRRYLSSVLVTNLSICLRTVIQEDIFFSILGVILYWAGKRERGWYWQYLPMDHVCMCLQTITYTFFFKLGVIYHWAGKSVCVCEVDKKGGMDNISLRPMFKFCTNDKFMHLFTNCYTSRYSRYIFLNWYWNWLKIQ